MLNVCPLCCCPCEVSICAPVCHMLPVPCVRDTVQDIRSGVGGQRKVCHAAASGFCRCPVPLCLSAQGAAVRGGRSWRGLGLAALHMVHRMPNWCSIATLLVCVRFEEPLDS